MRWLLVTTAFFTTLSAAHAEVRGWNFRVLLDEREVGQHQFTLRADGETRELRSEMRLDVRILIFSAYQYQHEAVERWKGDCLQSLAALTQTNGERQAVSAAAQGGRLVVDRTEGRVEHDGCVMSFAYWNPGILKARRLLNAQTGELLPVNVRPRGKEPLEVRGRLLSARRYRISAPNLEIDVWYAGERWVALEALASGGRRLRYELISKLEPQRK